MKIRWKDFELPTGIECDTESLTENYGHFSIEPFERGFGTTMGNTFRRVLLSAIEGAAVTAMRIDGIRCEFENLEGVYQDTSDIVMAIKQLYLRVESDEPIVLKLEKEGPCEVTAADIQPHQDVEVMNPDLLIATLSDGCKLEMELEVRKGRGFVLARENMEKAPPMHHDSFNVDSIYSPVQKVTHKVVGTRVGQRTDYERLEFEIWTNGVVSPREAINEAASIMRKHINPFLSYSQVNRTAKAEADIMMQEDEDRQEIEETLNLPISILEPSARTRNCLEAEGIQTLGQLVSLSEHELLKFRNFGTTSLNEIKEKLVEFNLSIGQQVEG